jgi:hypothetical protein
MKKMPADEYFEKAKLLGEEETERVLSRARTKLIRKMGSEKISELEVVAKQLETEDEQLLEWRMKMAEMRAKEKQRQKQRQKQT